MTTQLARPRVRSAAHAGWRMRSDAAQKAQLRAGPPIARLDPRGWGVPLFLQIRSCHKARFPQYKEATPTLNRRNRHTRYLGKPNEDRCLTSLLIPTDGQVEDRLIESPVWLKCSGLFRLASGWTHHVETR